MPYTDVELAWAAGFFDGEGCTTYHRGKDQSTAPRVRIGQSGDNGNELLEKFKAAVGEGKVYGPYKIAKGQTKVRWVCEIYGTEKSTKVIKLLWPWLGTEKRKQAQEVLRLT